MSANVTPLDLIDVRQSPAWAKYLGTLGWNSIRTYRGINIEIRKTPFGALVKIQKPLPLNHNDLEEIEKVCKKYGALFIKIEPYIGQDISILEDAGYETSWIPMTPTATYFIHLDNPENTLWSAVSHGAKYSIHRAEREGTEVKIFRFPQEQELKEFYEVLKYTGKLQKLYVPPLKQIHNQVEAFGEDGFLIMSYDKNGNICGGKWHVGYNNMVLYVSGGTSKIGRKNKSGYILLWKSILYLKSLGYKILDLEGKDDTRFPSFTKRWGGFTHFKQKFGGDVIEFPQPYVKYLNPTMKFLRKWSAFSV